MRQRAFEFSVAAEPTLELFIAGRNSELVQALESLREPAAERCIYIWGPAGSGRSHLLKAAVTGLARSGARSEYVDAADVAARLPQLAACDAVAIDDVERLDDAGQSAAFTLFNEMRSAGRTFLAAGNAPAMRLPLREDLVTRLGWGLVFEVQPITDEDAADALSRHASGRGFTLAPEVRDYLLARVPRDMPTLVAILDDLDRYSLEAKRPITVPLVRELLERRVGVAGSVEQ